MIYYVEDDDNIRELVLYTLKQMGMDVCGFSCAREFWSAVALDIPELVLLDIMMPEEDGLEMLRRLRQDARIGHVPVVMITAKGTEFDKVQGLDMGADDYITKPFGMAELIARIRARLRRLPVRMSSDSIAIGRILLDKRAHEVYLDGMPVPLTMKEFDLLNLLMENRGMAFSREQLLERVWDYSYEGSTRTIDVHIQTLRSKLGECGGMIETVRGVGYRFGGA